jgi:hypothetical protein
MSNIGSEFYMENKQDFKVLGDWRINWIEKKFFIMHGHDIGTPKEHWDMCVSDKKTDPKGINFNCRLENCNTKVPGGVVAAALTRRLNEALESRG